MVYGTHCSGLHVYWSSMVVPSMVTIYSIMTFDLWVELQ